MEAINPVSLSFNEESSYILSNNTYEFRLAFGTIGESIYFDLQEPKLLSKKYQNIFSLNTLQKMNYWFKQFPSMDKLVKIFNNMMKSKKFRIKNEENENNTPNNSNKIIYFSNALDEEDIIYIKLNLKEQNQNDIIKKLLQMINDLKEKNSSLEKKICVIDKTYGEKITLLEKEINILNEKINEHKKKNLININYSKLLNDSLIIKTKLDEDLINSWIAPNKNISYKLIYRASRDGDTENDFHRNCDNKAPTLVLGITPQGYIFGGYTTVNWNYYSGDYLPDSEAFVFSINQKKKFKTNDKNRSIYTQKGLLYYFWKWV